MHHPAYIIAEAGVNHNGDVKRAHELIDIAAAAGANAVKFQLFEPSQLVTRHARTAEYQATNLGDKKISQRDMLKKLTLPEGALKTLEKYCKKNGVDFLCTPFDHQSLAYLVAETKMKYLKLPSGEVTNGPFLLAAARTGMPIILSTGMSNLEEIASALSILHFGYETKSGRPISTAAATPSMLEELEGKVTLLHCVSQYPAPIEATNLLAMDMMAEEFNLPVGLSDHTLGITMPIAAVARGAVMIEKHFTYDHKAAGPDHAASLRPEQLKAMVDAIRDVARGLGKKQKQCVSAEENTRDIARKSIVAAKAIKKGEKFSEKNLACKRPATGPVEPNRLWALLDRKAKRDYQADDFIDAKELG